MEGSCVSRFNLFVVLPRSPGSLFRGCVVHVLMVSRISLKKNRGPNVCSWGRRHELAVDGPLFRKSFICTVIIFYIAQWTMIHTSFLVYCSCFYWRSCLYPFHFLVSHWWSRSVIWTLDRNESSCFIIFTVVLLLFALLIHVSFGVFVPIVNLHYIFRRVLSELRRLEVRVFEKECHVVAVGGNVVVLRYCCDYW